ncbi:MAG TPA: YbhB/YbcL family Raf kinase inhibitor-like protein [Myxococcales bacterium]|jgi:Raf kinase inhibitor-like YbhB/YbcL family protein|nr:YbhB/YbcL family Raf kinase inhibitor-like protein [Myxococcales bacterium]
MALTITSPAFENGAEIPALHTCDAKDVSPELRFGGVPQGAKSLVLIVHDPDAPDPAAPRMDWVHWILYNLPPGTRSLPQGVREGDLPSGTLQGLNDWKRTGWGGPCPPIGRHRYFFRLHALNAVLADLGPVTRQRLEREMQGHLLGTAELMGTYQRGGGRTPDRK